MRPGLSLHAHEYGATGRHRQAPVLGFPVWIKESPELQEFDTDLRAAGSREAGGALLFTASRALELSKEGCDNAAYRTPKLLLDLKRGAN
jgi:hypothetical protein